MQPAVITRRSFICSCSLATGAWAAGSGRASHAPSFQLLKTRVISHQPEFYHGWPTLFRRRNGQLILAFSGGRQAHICPFGRVEIMRSSDHGRTWSWPRTILDSAIDDRDSGVLETSKGTLLATTFTSLAYQDILHRALQANSWSKKKERAWLAVQRRLNAAQREGELGQWMLRSTDGGVTWSARYASIVHSPHGPIELSSGRLLYAGKELWTGRRRVGVAESQDDGVRWRWLAEIPARDGDDPQQYHELHAVEADDKRLIVHLRNHNPRQNREILQSESSDGGRSWTKPRAIGVWGLPSHLLRLQNGLLLMTYGYRRPPFGNQARISRDAGRTWSGPMTLSKDGASGDLGYPSTVQLGDKTLLTVWYELPRDSQKAVLRQAHWRFTG